VATTNARSGAPAVTAGDRLGRQGLDAGPVARSTVGGDRSA